MSKNDAYVYISKYPDTPPTWYWVDGLHDACIHNIEAFEFPFDYNRFTGEKRAYNRNCLTLRMNSEGALYDNTVKEIQFFNYKLLSDPLLLENRKTMWWLCDRLTKCDDHYILEIDLQNFDRNPQDFTLRIQFERAEVDR